MEEYELEHTGCARQEAVLVRGGNRLCGELTMQGAKNSTLPLLAAGRQVLWVCGEGFADGLASGPDTGQLLQVELENFGGIES